MNLPRRNIAANLLGSGWTAVMQLCFAPVYIHFLGMEAFGLVGVWLTIQALSVLFDLGLGSTLNRELARLQAHPGSEQRMRDTVRTLEIVYLPGALLLAIALVLAAPHAATGWLNVGSLDPGLARQALVMMGIAAALQWPYGLYSGGLLGLQRHVALNVVLTVVATLRGAGAAAALWLVAPSLQTFFAVQIAASAIQAGATAWLVWRSLPPASAPARFRAELLRGVREFAAGMVGITLLSATVTQLDKVVLSGVLPLEAFGYYTLAAMVAAGLSRVVGPVFAAMYPRLTELAARGDNLELRVQYHRGSQLVSVLVLPLALVLAFFAEELLVIWTGDALTAAHTAPVLSLLVVGTALHGIMHMPYALQLAHGWTQLALRINLVAAAVVVPATYLAAIHYGMVGAAWVWVILNAGYVIVGVPAMHRRLLKDELRRWYVHDLLVPLAASFSVTAGARWYIGENLPSAVLLPLLGGVLALSMLAAALCLHRFQMLYRASPREAVTV
jgi:O-antigen/teichoic acid export membrane protein